MPFTKDEIKMLIEMLEIDSDYWIDSKYDLELITRLIKFLQEGLK